MPAKTKKKKNSSRKVLKPPKGWIKATAVKITRGKVYVRAVGPKPNPKRKATKKNTKRRR